MFLRFLVVMIPLGLLGLGGCVSLDNVVGGISNAPDWFQKRRVEIRGNGYPDLNAVPVAAPIVESQTRLELSGQEAANARQALLGDPRSAAPDITAEDMEAVASQLRPQLPAISPKPEGFLSEADLAALRAQVESR